MRWKLMSAGVSIACAFALVALWTPRSAHAGEELPVNSYTYFEVGLNSVNDVNDAGIVVGDLDGEVYLVWDGGWADLGFIGVARAINNNNQVVGHVWSGAGYTAFLWDSTNGAQDLGNYGWASSLALDINDAGQVVGTVHDDAGGSHAFLWQDGSGFDLGVPDGFVSSWGIAINASGEMACTAMDADGVFGAFRWTPNAANGTTGSWVALDPTERSVAQGINGSGDVVGYVVNTYTVPMLWNSTGAHALGSYGYATAINDSGVVIGMANHPFLWDEVHGARDLTAISSPDSIYGGIGALRFSSAGAINASGQILATIDDYSTFLLTPSPLPPRPRNLRTSTNSTGRSLSWDASYSADSYYVKRGTSLYGPFTTVATVAGTSWTDTTADSGTSYFYAVSALNSYGESIESDATLSQPAAPPAPPTNLSATALKSSKGKTKAATLRWTQSSSADVAQNRIYRTTVTGGGYTLLATISAGTTFSDTSVAGRTTYYYVVTALSGTGMESAASNEASIRLR